MFLFVYLVGLIPSAAKYLPVQLLNSTDLLSGVLEVKEYLWAIGITILLCAVHLVFSVIIFNKKEIGS